MKSHISSGEQARRYFGRRPHIGIPTSPLQHRSAWYGVDIRRQVGTPLNDIQYALSLADIEEIEAAMAHARAVGKPTISLSASDFPLDRLQQRLEAIRIELGEGRGFALIKGVPVARWSAADSELFFWCLGQHLGSPGLQNPQGDLLGHVIDTGDATADPLVRLYRTASNINYHCDGADVVGLLCLRAADAGGTSRIASSVTVFNELLKARPELATRLFGDIRMDRRNEENPGELPYSILQPSRYDGSTLRTFYHSDYFRSVARHVGALPEAEQELLDCYESIAEREDVRFEMQFEPGDVQLLSNHTVIHARTAYEDRTGRQRHLLRLWLTLDPC